MITAESIWVTFQTALTFQLCSCHLMLKHHNCFASLFHFYSVSFLKKIIMHKLFCRMTFLFRVVIESSRNEYTMPSSSSLGCKHFWEGEGETLEKPGSVLSCCLSVTWNPVTCDIKKGHFDNLTTRMPAYFSLLLANEWQITQCLQLTIKIFCSFFAFYGVLWPRGTLKHYGASPASLQFSHFFPVEFS